MDNYNEIQTCSWLSSLELTGQFTCIKYMMSLEPKLCTCKQLCPTFVQCSPPVLSSDDRTCDDNVRENQNPQREEPTKPQPTCRSIPAGLVRFLSSTALSRSARDRCDVSSSASPNMSSSPMPLPPLVLGPPVATSPRPGMAWLMLTLFERSVSWAGKRPPVSVAESCARIFSTCQGGARIAVVLIPRPLPLTLRGTRPWVYVAVVGKRSVASCPLEVFNIHIIENAQQS